MLSRALGPAVRRACSGACSGAAPAVGVAHHSSLHRHTSLRFSSGGSSGSSGLPSRCPATTYEGALEDSDRLQQLMNCNGGFRRSTFIKDRGVARLDEKYTMGEQLGQGATAVVYRAVSRLTGQAVAVKVISKDFVQDNQMLQNEIAIHKATDHPNVLRLLETFEDDSKLYLVCELCSGGDLWKFLASYSGEFSSGLPEEDALVVFQQVANTVVYLHSRGIVHRDLKPGNFLIPGVPTLGSDSRKKEADHLIIKLTDFGVSAYGCSQHQHHRHRLTRRVGTEGFMAPEILKSQPYNEKADVFSMGCILHMLLTGHPPKMREDGSYTISKIRLRFVDPAIRELVERMMAPNPEDRPSSYEVITMPLMRRARRMLEAKSMKLDAMLLDRMYAYSSYPLLKKAAIVAMVTRAENFDESSFVPLIQKFTSLCCYEGTGVEVNDIYRALVVELLGDMKDVVQKTLEGKDSVSERPGRAQSALRTRRSRRRKAEKQDPSPDGCPVLTRFCSELRSDVEQLMWMIDVGGTGVISYSEWLAATIDPQWYRDSQRLQSAFRLFDQDGDGLISEEDLQVAIPDVFHKLRAEEVLNESQLCAKQQKSWISFEHWSLLIGTESPSSFTLKRIADGFEDPLTSVAEDSLTSMNGPEANQHAAV